MKNYCINDFLDNSYGYISLARQAKLSNLSIQVEDGLAMSDGYAKKGETIGKLHSYMPDGITPVSSTDIIAPNDGYYIFETRFLLRPNSNVDIQSKVLSYYEDLGDDIDDEDFEKEYFINTYNELLPAIFNYYHRFVNVFEYKKKCESIGNCEYEVGFPKTDTPKNFLHILDKILKGRFTHTEKEVIRDCKTLINMVENCASILHTCLLLYPEQKKVFFNNELLNFDDIKRWRDDLVTSYEIEGDDGPLEFCDKSNASVHEINHVRAVINSIVKVNKTKDISHLYTGSPIRNIPLCSYSIWELISDDDYKKLSDCEELELKYVNQFDIDNYDGEDDDLLSHFCFEGEPLIEIRSRNGEISVQIPAFVDGYYRIDMPSFFSPVFLDIPIILYATKAWAYEKNEWKISKAKDFKYTIKTDRFSKTSTIKWQANNKFQILPLGWYEFIIQFEYQDGEPSIKLGFQNGFSKKVIKGEEYCDETGVQFFLLLENDASLIFDKRDYLETWVIEDSNYLIFEYKLSSQVIDILTKYAVSAVRIVVSKDQRFEYEAEPLFFEEFKKFARRYYDAIAKCDPTIKIDNSHSAAITESCFVYLMHDTSNGYYKIGISNNPEYREHTLQSEKPTIELVKAKEFPVRAIAEAFEAALHKTYATKRLRGEWFRLEPKDVNDVIVSLS